jgi:hypothetical protein
VLSVIFMSIETLSADYADQNGSKEVLFLARAQTDHPHLSPLPSKGEEV